MQYTFDDIDKAYGEFLDWHQDRNCYDWAKEVIADICDKIEINWHGPRGAECFLVGYRNGKRKSFALQVWVFEPWLSVQESSDAPETRKEIRNAFI